MAFRVCIQVSNYVGSDIIRMNDEADVFADV